MILCLETATPSCSVALIHDGNVLQCEEEPKGQNHSEKLTLFIDSVMKKAGVRFNQLDAVAVSMGPGSYTGLRIGVSTAKGLCYATDAPLIAIDTLHAMAFGGKTLIHNDNDSDIFIPMIDARRMEVYAALYERSLQTAQDTSAIVVEAHTFDQWLDKRPVVFFGNGAAKCQDIIRHPNAHFIADIVPLAQHMMPLAEKKMALGQTEDVAYFEPFYLKDFVAGKPKPLF